MTASNQVELLPLRMDLSLCSPSDNLPECSANLMPFTIDYNGPAPVDSFLVQRPADSSSTKSSSASLTDEASQTSISAFRGRAIQSTPLPLPEGYVAKIVSLSRIAPIPAAESSGSAERRIQEQEREKKRQRISAPKPPARQQKFSMDSDDDENDEKSDYDVASPELEEVSPEPEPVAPAEEQPDKNSDDRVPKIRISSIANVINSTLTIWGPDGPIDKGDDTFFRTVGEWHGVVAPLSQIGHDGRNASQAKATAEQLGRLSGTALNDLLWNASPRGLSADSLVGEE
ncbi:uncharacterized protein UTRI_06142_B [Ustilago trichophora]|uniref:Uncharacterized protein n=1 Tax=Ustilago trichophora TaxID=86804 RepID=A0A5C3EI02_9BASI|nr:uncharacterized protein UTRI_06142_B [Ustilago trichophora]